MNLLSVLTYLYYTIQSREVCQGLWALTTQNKPLSSEQWIQNYGSHWFFEYIYDDNLGKV